MKRLILFVIIGMMVFVCKPAHAEFSWNDLDYGVSAGPVIGDNAWDRETWEPQFRAHIGFDLFPGFDAEVGVRFLKLEADANFRGRRAYSSKLFIGDLQLVFRPIISDIIEPYVYAGIGMGKDTGQGETDFLPLIPMGFGFRTMIAPRLMFDIRGTYDIVLSDDLDGYTRTSYLNPLTDGEHDSFYGFLAGFTIIPERIDYEALALAEKLRKEEEARQAALLADPDGDGLTTGDELNTYLTDPQKADTDGDGLLDGAELRVHKTDPLVADTDGDGLSDGAEVNQYNSNPLVADTDMDGLDDGVEVNEHQTDPAKSDTDGDNLSDADEINVYLTNPLLIDTDGGGLDDGAEIERDKDPLDASDDGIVFSSGRTLVLEGINFETSSAQLTANSTAVLDDVYAAMMDFPDAEVLIAGHSDSSGNDDFNMELSRKRAESVKTWLVAQGIDASRLSTVGKGETEPIADNATAEGRAQNRRIEFIVE